MEDDTADTKDEVDILEEILSNGDYVVQYFSDEFEEPPCETDSRKPEKPPLAERGVERPVRRGDKTCGPKKPPLTERGVKRPVRPGDKTCEPKKPPLTERVVKRPVELDDESKAKRKKLREASQIKRETKCSDVSKNVIYSEVRPVRKSFIGEHSLPKDRAKSELSFARTHKNQSSSSRGSRKRTVHEGHRDMSFSHRLKSEVSAPNLRRGNFYKKKAKVPSHWGPYTKSTKLDKFYEFSGWSGENIIPGLENEAVERISPSSAELLIDADEYSFLEERFEDDFQDLYVSSDGEVEGYGINSPSSDSESHSDPGKRLTKKQKKKGLGAKNLDYPVKEKKVNSKHHPQGSWKSSYDSKSARSYKPRNKKAYGEYMRKLDSIFHDAKYFVIKSNNAENIRLSMTEGVWSTLPKNEFKLNMAFRKASNVLLIFSVTESGRFAGFARLECESRKDIPPVSWISPPGIPEKSLGGIFRVDWLSRKALPFMRTYHLYNPWNNGKPVKIGRDGQEIEPHIGEKLCRLFPMDEELDISPVVHKSKIAAMKQLLRSRHPREHYGGHQQRAFDTSGRNHSFGRYTGLSSCCLGLNRIGALFPLGLLISASKMCLV